MRAPVSTEVPRRTDAEDTSWPRGTDLGGDMPGTAPPFCGFRQSCFPSAFSPFLSLSLSFLPCTLSKATDAWTLLTDTKRGNWLHGILFLSTHILQGPSFVIFPEDGPPVVSNSNIGPCELCISGLGAGLSSGCLARPRGWTLASIYHEPWGLGYTFCFRDIGTFRAVDRGGATCGCSDGS